MAQDGEQDAEAETFLMLTARAQADQLSSLDEQLMLMSNNTVLVCQQAKALRTNAERLQELVNEKEKDAHTYKQQSNHYLVRTTQSPAFLVLLILLYSIRMSFKQPISESINSKTQLWSRTSRSNATKTRSQTKTKKSD